MNYQEALLANVTKAEAKREIEQHGLSFLDFVKDEGLQENYCGETVLNWLGY